ncbi:hypothetical protein Q1W71_15235 [Flavobacterium pectinovorum]|uniref:hypothetical protein n=1 Tax=Flavobacterium pectinovorum TaxID=29533 RepID=UPI00265FD9AA|nr:hypothetical protein [Flavobacterium pectinovorum]WKL46306.1 hypothetical protein Q1W71_15235 [Flavobacterium pectinovorum]
MKRFLFAFIIILAASLSVKAQNKKFTYLQFDISASLAGNNERYESEDYPDQKNKDWFVPDGLGSKIGYGIHYKKWITLGIHSGIDWKWEDKLVAVPVYLNFGLSPKVGENTIITAQAGYGKGFALGRGNLNGEYRKLRIGIGSDDFIIFIETAQYDIILHNQKSINSINLGISVVNFDL